MSQRLPRAFIKVTLHTNAFYLTTMKSLCIGDSHINRLKTFVGKTPSSIVYNVDSLSEVLYYGISGGRVSKHRHLVSLTSAVRRIRPSHAIVMMGSNPRFRRSILRCRVPRFSPDSVPNSAKEYQPISVYNRA